MLMLSKKYFILFPLLLSLQTSFADTFIDEHLKEIKQKYEELEKIKAKVEILEQIKAIDIPNLNDNNDIAEIEKKLIQEVWENYNGSPINSTHATHATHAKIKKASEFFEAQATNIKNTRSFEAIVKDNKSEFVDNFELNSTFGLETTGEDWEINAKVSISISEKKENLNLDNNSNTVTAGVVKEDVNSFQFSVDKYFTPNIESWVFLNDKADSNLNIKSRKRIGAGLEWEYKHLHSSILKSTFQGAIDEKSVLEYIVNLEDCKAYYKESFCKGLNDHIKKYEIKDIQEAYAAAKSKTTTTTTTTTAELEDFDALNKNIARYLTREAQNNSLYKLGISASPIYELEEASSFNSDLRDKSGTITVLKNLLPEPTNEKRISLRAIAQFPLLFCKNFKDILWDISFFHEPKFGELSDYKQELNVGLSKEWKLAEEEGSIKFAIEYKSLKDSRPPTLKDSDITELEVNESELITISAPKKASYLTTKITYTF